MTENDATRLDEKETPFDKCDPDCNAGPRPPGADHAGPPREAGGTTGAGNLSHGQASRTGGATGGVPDIPDDRALDRDIPPSA